jgi:hypothetical protein
MTCPFCVGHHVNIYSNMLRSLIKLNVNHFFQQLWFFSQNYFDNQNFLINILKKIKLGNQKNLVIKQNDKTILITTLNDWKKFIITWKFLNHCSKKLVNAKNLYLSNIQWLDFHHWSNNEKINLIIAQKLQSPFFSCQIVCSKNFNHQIVLLKNIGHKIEQSKTLITTLGNLAITNFQPFNWQWPYFDMMLGTWASKQTHHIFTNVLMLWQPHDNHVGHISFFIVKI